MRILRDNRCPRYPSVTPTRAFLLFGAGLLGWLYRRRAAPRNATARVLLAQAIALEEQAARIRGEIARL